MSAFTSLLGDELLTKDGAKGTASVLDGKKVVGLYFSAHWCGPCRGFTPKLAESYKKLTAAGKELEIVFVSSDRDEGAFTDYFGEMPWLALPYAARDAKAKLSRKYKVQGIPTLVLLDSTGATLTTDGRSTILSDPEGAEFPWPKKSPLDILAGNDGEFMSTDGDTVSLDDLKGKKLGLYFSAHWCPPCKAFTPKLIETYQAMRKAGRDDFEFVFVSSDRSTEEFHDYFQTMPWVAIPPGDKRKEQLSKAFGVEGIPTFVMLDADGSTINANARGAVMGDPEGAKFPWAPPPAADVAEGPDGLNESTCVMAMLGSLDEAAQKAAVEAVTAVAQRTIDASKAAGEDEPPFLFFYSTDNDEQIASQIVRLTSVKPDAGSASLLILDIPNDGAFHVSAAKEVTAETVDAMLADFKAGKLERKQLGG